MNEALCLEVRILLVDRSEQFLDADVLSLLSTSLHLCPAFLEVDFEDLIGYWQLALGLSARLVILRPVAVRMMFVALSG